MTINDAAPDDEGYRDYGKLAEPKYPDNDDYMGGWRAAEAFEKMIERETDQ